MKDIVYKDFVRDERNYFFLFIFIFSAYCIYNLLRWPVIAIDTDLWYHLSSGRYIFNHNAIPHDSYFSFMVPARKWVDYYWLFQVFVYKIQQYTGYYGLVYLRALLFIGLMYFILRCFAAHLYKRKAYLAISIMFSLYILFLIDRYPTIRPHMFSYFFIVFFIYTIEYRRKMIFVLPLLALFWVNLHGIEYPVMLLIALAYITELAIRRIIYRKEVDKVNLRIIIPLVLVLFMVYCTPHGIHLIGVPLTPTDSASQYLNELRKFSFTELSSLNFTRFCAPPLTTFVIILLFSCFAFIHTLFMPQRRRISHVILFAGGLFLLTKGQRFAFEFVLLSIPIISNALNSNNLFFSHNEERRRFPIKIIFICFLSISPILCLYYTFKDLPKFPFSNARLPHGVAVFLQKVDVGGAVLNLPKNGGYFQWALYPRYKIFMDTEIPFLFTDEDMFIAKKVFENDQVFSDMLTQYNPPFVTVPISMTAFSTIVKKHPQYKPVFFDDAEALYVNENHYPLIVEKHLLKYIDPLMFHGMTFPDLMNHPNLNMVLDELERMYRIDPEIGIINRNLWAINHIKGEYSRAIFHAEAFIENQPESEIGYALKGSSLKELKRYDEALKSYKTALRKNGNNIILQREVGLIYFQRKQYRNAYDSLIRTVDLYSQDASYKDFYFVIYSAVKANLRGKAAFLFKCIVKTLPPDDKEWNDKYKQLRAMVANQERKTE